MRTTLEYVFPRLIARLELTAKDEDGNLSADDLALIAAAKEVSAKLLGGPQVKTEGFDTVTHIRP